MNVIGIPTSICGINIRLGDLQTFKTLPDIVLKSVQLNKWAAQLELQRDITV